MFFRKHFVVLKIAVPPGQKYKRSVEFCLGFLFSYEFGCNYDYFFLIREKVLSKGKLSVQF